jgi:hypothetical protein
MADSKESEFDLVETPAIDRRIFVIRGRQVMLERISPIFMASKPVFTEIMRAFVELRRVASSYAELHERLESSNARRWAALMDTTSR